METIKLVKIEVLNRNLSKNDGDVFFTFGEAIEAVKKLSNNWRLPNIEELKEIYTLHKAGGYAMDKNGNMVFENNEFKWIGIFPPYEQENGLKPLPYWSSSLNKDNNPLLLHFDSGAVETGYSTAFVRPVRFLI